jgi:hypothetical protein
MDDDNLSVKASTPDEVYETIRRAFYDMLVIQMFGNLVRNMGPAGKQYTEDVISTFKAEMQRQAARDGKIIAEKFKDDGGFDEEAHVERIGMMTNEIAAEFRDIFSKVGK